MVPEGGVKGGPDERHDGEPSRAYHIRSERRKNPRRFRMAKKTAKRPPWKRANPKAKSARTTLTKASKERARARAETAGRMYPNLVDDKRAAGEQKKRAR
jgi:hypothetical protein